MDNILSVTLTPRETVKADAVMQYDKGVTLLLKKSDGISYTANTEVQVTDGVADAVRYPVTLNEDGSCYAVLGDHLFRNSGLFYAYIYNIYTDYEQTTATVCIPVKERPRYECDTSTADKDEENKILVSIREAAEEAQTAAQAATDAANEAQALLDETVISTPTAEVKQTDDGATVTITDKNGTTTANIYNGKDGANGQDGAPGKDGTDGKDGEKGADGVTPSISASATVTDTTGTPVVQVTKAGDDTAPVFSFAFSGLKGERGDQGIQGVQGERGEKGDTGAQGVQGIQGIQGEKGDKGDQGEKGDAYTITDADYSAIADKVLASLEDADTTSF